jgi:Outer membrane protein beta-barrel domain
MTVTVLNYANTDMSFKTNKIAVGACMLCLLAVQSAYSQFNTRFRLDIKGTYSVPLYPAQYKIDLDHNPYIFPNFKNGIGGSFGLSYLLTKNLYVGGQFGFSSFRDWQDPLEDSDPEFGSSADLSAKYGKAEFDVASLAATLHYEFFPDSRINFFLTGQIGIYSYFGKVPPRLHFIRRENIADNSPFIKDMVVEMRYNAIIVDLQQTIGYGIGAGINYHLSSKMTLFLQANYTMINTAKNAQLNISTQYGDTSFGLRLNVLKKRSLL